MPFKWQKGKNPYVSNSYGTLQLGPNASPQEVKGKTKSLMQLLSCGQRVQSASGEPLTEYEVAEADKILTSVQFAPEELLLVHPQPKSEGPSRLKALAEQVRKAASFSGRPIIPLRHSIGIFWFVPLPGPEAAELPPWEELGMTGPADPEDLALDIVFDE
jgi:hypothetical protein